MLASLVGWIPAIILPSATAIQLYQIIKTKKSAGISKTAWSLYAIADFGAYIFTEKLLSAQAILAFFLTGVICVLIVFFAKKYEKK